ncbi:WD40/YVTN/BNR-like repeat-containing protein [Robiginitalea aurantiaca]|uniref:Glycosyl hydrolase n=1 Tax=Robiginitalea aurantiaca TaxID=3056915 RepID=A0ABT7WCZ5_9FLAO|nr:glycosyl hydrolase [Robiginitalea aurantiaca]MDM9630684.1 glycosyl hydrolase [Robiginitalea aurantiaca]
MFRNFRYPALFSIAITFLSVLGVSGQQNDLPSLEQVTAALEFREIGPAVMGGRIADIAVNPQNPNTWYVAVGSGGLWKTMNRGTTWKPVFDEQASYSLGCVTLDPGNPETVWVGSGENVSGRHVGWGDGVYLSKDGGRTWQNKGLKDSEHIGKILVDPRNSDIVFVAAEGPLWASGGQRGLFRSADGGNTWDLVLQIDANTGVTDIEFDPSNPDVLYAAAYQRRRHVWSLMAGGPNSGIYKSTDNGLTWKQVQSGLPKGDMGKIGLGVSPANPNLVYATIEAAQGDKGFYRSTDKGESWERRNSYISGGTGPHYYQEIEVSPTDPNLVYQMDVFLHVTRDGGASFDYLGTGREKHSDNHTLWIDPNDGQHLIAGTDAGLYESYDQGATWRHFPNLPVSQFYKLGLDNAEPFYNIVGGAQDLGTLIGPSRTQNIEGVRNQDWYVPLGADGYESVFDPEDPNTVYMEIQQGLLHRLDRRTEEVLNIQPQPGPSDPPERWNWDSPVIVSPHNSRRLYFGSQRVWRSEDRGDSWSAISGDLTTNTNRYELEMGDRVWSVDALYDTGAMSKYATLTAISESPGVEGLLYTGSDDGMLQVSEDGGQNWRKMASLPKVPTRAFITDIEASSHDDNTVFVSVDVHKKGDFKPYLFMSSDRGRSWKSITSDLPAKTIVWVVKQDHLDPNLLFIGTEYGIYFSHNRGGNWIQLKGGLPTIPFRDIELHKRDNDLVGASFGRGFYVLDDYSALREISAVFNRKANTLFDVRDAWWYIPNTPMQAKAMPTLGSTLYVGDNPPFGAVLTYYLSEVPKTGKSGREDREKKLRAQNASIPFPGWDQLRAERLEGEPEVLLLIKDSGDNPVRWLKAEASEGLHRTSWDLRFAAPNPVSLEVPDFQPPWAGDPQGPLAAPGTYSATLYILHDGKLTAQGSPKEFRVRPLPGDDSNTDFEAISAFQQSTGVLSREISASRRSLSEAGRRLNYMEAALPRTTRATSAHFEQLNALEDRMAGLQERLTGDQVMQRMNESTVPSIASRVGGVVYGHWETRQPPTATQKEQVEIARREYQGFKGDLRTFMDDLDKFQADLEAAGAPWTPGQKLE